MRLRDFDLIAGPTFLDLERIGLDGGRLDFATGFYSTGAFSKVRFTPARFNFMCRLDLDSPDEWKKGLVAPDALLEMLQGCLEAGTRVSLYTSPLAHAKVYIGSAQALVGSSNFSVRGFGGGDEVIQRTKSLRVVERLRKALDGYRVGLRATTLDELSDYVRKHRAGVRRYQRERRRRQLPVSQEDRIPQVSRDMNPRFGDYEAFKTWLQQQPEEAADVVYDRALGQSNLQGHIHRNFYGLRQFLLTYPSVVRGLISEHPDLYHLFEDKDTGRLLSSFVGSEATDEDDFELDVWKTYLPIEFGGRADKRGGTIGNLNRMLPLMARYLSGRV
ncbi:MAG: hypothetical protein V1694_03085 [Candidatus Eisenbacteria bacterium]